MSKKEDVRIVFFGTPDFAVASLSRLVEDGFNIVSVVTATDKPAGRGHKMLSSAVKQYAVEHNLPVLQPEKLKDPDFVAQLESLHADLFIVIAFRMLPRVVWSMPLMGTFNLHGSLLPKYRGAAPINRAVMAGERVTGVTTFLLNDDIDTGDILSSRSIEIGEDEDAGSVHDRLMTIGADLTVDTVNQLIEGTISPIPQDNVNVEPTPAPKIFGEDCLIDWSLSAEQVHNHIRGLAPYPGARTYLGDCAQPMKILKSRLTDKCKAAASGSIYEDNGRMFVACGDGRLLEIVELQPSGKKRMAAADYLRGARLSGAVFTKNASF